MVSDKSWLCRTAPKLKHTALKQIYYQLQIVLQLFEAAALIIPRKKSLLFHS